MILMLQHMINHDKIDVNTQNVVELTMRTQWRAHFVLGNYSIIH
jgi:hypothetical protein